MNPVVETRSPFRFPSKPLSLLGAVILCLGLSPCLMAAVPVQQKKKPSPAKEARAALVAAGKLTRVPKGSSKKARLDAKARAVEAYTQVEARFVEQAPIVALARFRRGQLLGRMGQEEQALRAYRGALSADRAGIGARAMLEAGHLERRIKRYSQALGFYRESASMAQPKPEARSEVPGSKPESSASSGVQAKASAANLRYGSEARLWIGVTLSSLGRVPDARKCWSDLAAEPARDARLRIKAFDRLAMSYMADKQEEEAKKVLADADESLAAACDGKSKTAQSLRRSLNRMRARKALAKAETSRQQKRGEQGIR